MSRRRLVVGISGATGIALGVKILELARAAGLETHLVVSAPAQLTRACETGLSAAGLAELAAFPAGVCADMETAAVAQVARQNGLAWAAVRMISDTADAVDVTAVLDYLTSSGAKALSYILRETIDRLLAKGPAGSASRAAGPC
jgi:hypothetical protein